MLIADELVSSFIESSINMANAAVIESPVSCDLFEAIPMVVYQLNQVRSLLKRKTPIHGGSTHFESKFAGGFHSGLHFDYKSEQYERQPFCDKK